MTDLDERLRAELNRVADGVDVPRLPTGADYRASTRRRLDLLVPIVAAAATIALVVAGAVVLLTGRPSGVPAAEGGPAAWPTRGPRAADTSLVMAAVRSWDAAPLPSAELPHHDVHVLYADHTVTGDVVVLTGVDALGGRRVAWLNTDATSDTAFKDRLHLVADKLLPGDGSTGLLAFYGFRPTPRPTHDNLLIALAPPGTPQLQWRDDLHDWRTIPTTDGAGVLVDATETDSLNVSVRAGDSGDGTRVLDDPAMFAGLGGQIEHDLDASEQPPSTETCTGNVCSASASAGAGGSGGSIPLGAKGGWSDLRYGGGSAFDRQGRRIGGWDEFASEALLMAQRARPSGGYSYGESWSGLLDDGTGLYLLDYTAGDGPQQLLLYVDRPEWFGGRLGADVRTSGSTPVPALAALVPGRHGTDLAVIETDGLHAQWRSDGGPWQDISARDHVAVADVTGTALASIRYRVTDASGATVASGTPYADALS